MNRSSRMILGAAAGCAALAVALTGCSSGGGNDTAPSTTPAATAPSPVTAPIVLPYGTARTTASVGQEIDFDVEMSQADWTIKSSDPKVVEVTPGSEGSAVMNPGGLAVAPGTAKVTLTLPGGGKIWFVEVTVN